MVQLSCNYSVISSNLAKLLAETKHAFFARHSVVTRRDQNRITKKTRHSTVTLLRQGIATPTESSSCEKTTNDAAINRHSSVHE